MKTGEFRGAGPFAAEWMLTPGRHTAPDDRPRTAWRDYDAAGDALELSETGVDGAWIRIDEPATAPDAWHAPDA